jgi:hypothetical protein
VFCGTGIGQLPITARNSDNIATRFLETGVLVRGDAGSALHQSAQSLIFALQQAIAASPLLGVSSLDSGRSLKRPFFCQIAAG